MEGNWYSPNTSYQKGKYQRQLLRADISPQTYQKLQVNDNPSLKSQNAYKALIHDQLERQMLQHEIEKTRNGFYKDHSTKHKPYKATNSVNPNYSSAKHNNIFRDYDIEKNNKVQQHIIKNYDGGQSFYNLQDRYLQQITNKNESLKEELKTQVDYKRIMKDQEKNKRNQQNQSFKQYTEMQNLIDHKNKLNMLYNQRVLQEQIKQQAQYQIARNKQKQSYDMRTIGRHNPITNPIEYHIDNPYILKKIQERNILDR